MEPAVWVVLGMVACVHGTYSLGRRLKRQPNWTWLFVAALIPITFGVVILGSEKAAGSFVPWAVTLSCGTYLAMRTARKGIAMGILITYGAIAAVAISEICGLASSDSYSRGENGWFALPGLPKERLRTLWRSANGGEIRELPRGIADDDSVLYHPDTPAERNYMNGPFLRQTSDSAWFTPLTGLYRTEFRRFHIWTPGGEAKHALNQAVLIEIDSSGKSIGAPLPLAAYDDEAVHFPED